MPRNIQRWLKNIETVDTLSVITTFYCMCAKHERLNLKAIVAIKEKKSKILDV